MVNVRGVVGKKNKMKTPCHKYRWCIFKEDSSMSDWRYQYHCTSFQYRLENPDPVVGIRYVRTCVSIRQDPKEDCKYFEVKISKQIGPLEMINEGNAVHEK